jgi:16S rRNA C967 or C1407 C5-methylase (RsmB/RsmF family)/NOL1/NOP2/fmu family ribosome biogenesis protein
MSYILPPSLVQRLGEDPLFDMDGFVRTHQNHEVESSIRIHPLKWHLPTDIWDPIPWCKEGFYLPNRPIYTLDPLFHAGAYYVQEASSMFLAEVIRQLKLDESPCKALDLCASPGGKSTLLNSALHPESLLVANEIVKSRAHTLEENLVRWGYPNTMVTNNDPAMYGKLKSFFDLMVVDAPCSGSGMFHKEPETMEEWSEAAVKLCHERQQRILADSLSTLKKDGYLIYSTCSYSKEENEDIVDWLMSAYNLETVKMQISSEWGIVETKSTLQKGFGYRFYPHKLRGEGLFMAVFQKKSEEMPTQWRKKDHKKGKLDSIVDGWVTPRYESISFLQDEVLHLFPQRWEDDLHLLKQHLYIKRAGVALGKCVKNNLIPDHELALNTVLDPQISKVNLDLESAQNYLRKKNIEMHWFDGLPLGWTLVAYQQIPLGWVKTMQGNRMNNYYPMDWRIVHL